MSETIKEFLVDLGFKVDEAGLTRFTNGVKSASERVAIFGAAVSAAAAGVFYGVAKIAENLDQMNDLADRVNTTVDAIERLSYAAQLAGSNADAAKNSLEGLSRAAGGASVGMGRAVEVFKEIGIQVKDANGKLKNTDELLFEIGDKIKNYDRGKQLFILSRLGIDQTMLQTITGGLKEVQGEITDLYSATGYNANEAAKSAAVFMDALDRMKLTLSVISKVVGARLFKTLSQGMDNFRKTLVFNAPKIIDALEPILDIILRIGGAFFTLVGRVMSAVGVVVTWLKKAHDATGGWSTGILALAAAWKAFNLAFLATPLGVIIGLGAAIAALVDDFLTWKEGGESFIDWGKWKPQIDQAVATFTTLGDVILWLWDVFSKAFGGITKLLTGDFKGAWESVKGIADKITGLVTGNAGNINLGSPALGPSPQAAAALNGNNQNLNQQTQIIVQGSSDPNATARSVAGEQNRVNGDMARNLKGAVR